MAIRIQNVNKVATARAITNPNGFGLTPELVLQEFRS